MKATSPWSSYERLARLQFLAAAGISATAVVAAHRGDTVPCWAGLVMNLLLVGMAGRHTSREARRAYLVASRIADSEARLRRQNAELEGTSVKLSDTNRKLAELAATDGLTGLVNRRRLDADLTRIVNNARDRHDTVSVLLLDVDKFKDYNDEFGHPSGDGVLRGVAALLKQAVRDGDVAGRYGGEEFLAILPGTDAERAVRVAERIRRAVEREVWPGRAVTVSIGIATLGAGVADPDSMVAAADRSLYECKRRGRNRVIHAGDLDRAAADPPAEPWILALPPRRPRNDHGPSGQFLLASSEMSSFGTTVHAD